MRGVGDGNCFESEEEKRQLIWRAVDLAANAISFKENRIRCFLFMQNIKPCHIYNISSSKNGQTAGNLGDRICTKYARKGNDRENEKNKNI